MSVAPYGDWLDRARDAARAGDLATAQAYALISIAQDVRTLAIPDEDRDIPEPLPLRWTLTSRDISTGARMVDGEFATRGEAIRALRQAQAFDMKDNGLPFTSPRVEYDGLPIDDEERIQAP